jgi:hypothetical protein
MLTTVPVCISSGFRLVDGMVFSVKDIFTMAR